MRIAQRTMYRSFITNMNKNLSDYMDSNIQSATQKRINKPSDDPVGMARVLAYRSSIARNEQYISNSKEAAAQLASTDSALIQASTILSKMLEKANQISTETVTKENRLQTASELRQLFSQLLNLANTSFNGSHLFSGHKTDQPAYREGLGITTKDDNLTGAERNDGSKGVPWEISGSADRPIMVRFMDDGEVGTDTIRYVYSKDGGETWVPADPDDPATPPKTLTPGDTTLDLDGVTVKIPTAGPQDKDLKQNVQVKAYDPDLDVKGEDDNKDNSISRTNGTVLFIRPTAYYQGDDNDPPPLVDQYGPSKVDSADAYGNFSGDVRIRLDETANVGADGKVKYSYSLDNGVTWVTSTADTRAGGSKLRLQVPGGYLDVTPQPGERLEAGQQFVVRPRRSDQGIEIAEGEFLSVTNCGKDIFGGLYTPAGASSPIPAEGGDKNIFEVLSNLIAWAETGPSDGCGESVAAVKTAIEGLQTSTARVGGKEQRVSLNVTILETHHDDQVTRMSSIEDADLTELLTRLAQQQMAYQSILQSSSMIMQLNLTKFI